MPDCNCSMCIKFTVESDKGIRLKDFFKYIFISPFYYNSSKSGNDIQHSSQNMTHGHSDSLGKFMSPGPDYQHKRS